jgi:starvation-inducible DNA-binding protein
MIFTLSLSPEEIKSSTTKLSVFLANTYTLYLKTQNYHWNIIDPYFSDLHILFEKQYTELAESVDEIAERIRTLGVRAPGTLAEFMQLKTLNEGKTDLNGQEMLSDLLGDYQIIIRDLRAYIKDIDSSSDEGTKDFLTSHLVAFEKQAWILQSHHKK